MRFSKFLNQILGQKSKIKVLRYLVNYKKEISMRELSREINIVPSNLSLVLKVLQTEGALVSKQFGRSLVFSLNNDHYLVKEVIIPLFQKEKNIKGELKKVILKNITFSYESIILFGSVQKGEEQPFSDIDIAFVVKSKDIKKAEEELLELNTLVNQIFSNTLSPLVISSKEFKKRLKNNDSLISSIAREGEVLAGKIISELL